MKSSFNSLNVFMIFVKLNAYKFGRVFFSHWSKFLKNPLICLQRSPRWGARETEARAEYTLSYVSHIVNA